MKQVIKTGLAAMAGMMAGMGIMFASAAGSQPGSEMDPLVTKSYVDQRIAAITGQTGAVTPTGVPAAPVDSEAVAQLQTDVGELTHFIIDALTGIDSLKARMNAMDSGFVAVEVPAGKTVLLSGGAEIIVRSGESHDHPGNLRWPGGCHIRSGSESRRGCREPASAHILANRWQGSPIQDADRLSADPGRIYRKMTGGRRMIRKKQRQTLVVAGLIVLTLLFGILPILKRDDKELSKFGYRAGDKIDVAVIGMEPEGIAAAVAAARAGMNTLLITSEPDPASYMSSCLLNHMVPQEGRIDGRKVTLAGPVFRDMFGGVESTFTESTYLRNMLRVMAGESRLKTIYNATLTGVASDARSVSSITLYAGGEMKTIRASIFIDATEGGLLLDMLQVPFTRGSEDLGAKGFFEPLSFNFRIRGINWDDMRTIAKVGGVWNGAFRRADGLSAIRRKRQARIPCPDPAG